MGILEPDTIQQADKKRKKDKSTTEEQKNFLKPSSAAKIFVKSQNTWAVHHVRYSGPFLKWTGEKLR